MGQWLRLGSRVRLNERNLIIVFFCLYLCVCACSLWTKQSLKCKGRCTDVLSTLSAMVYLLLACGHITWHNITTLLSNTTLFTWIIIEHYHFQVILWQSWSWLLIYWTLKHRDWPGLLPCDLSYHWVAIAVMTPQPQLADGRPPLCYFAKVHFSQSTLFSVSLQPLE